MRPVSVRRIGPGWLSLVLSMDPGRVVVDVPGIRGGAEVLARFCRQLAHEAAYLAATLEPGGQPSIARLAPSAQRTRYPGEPRG